MSNYAPVYTQQSPVHVSPMQSSNTTNTISAQSTGAKGFQQPAGTQTTVNQPLIDESFKYKGQLYELQFDLNRKKIVKFVKVMRNKMVDGLVMVLGAITVGLFIYDYGKDVLSWITGVRRLAQKDYSQGLARMSGFTIGNLKREAAKWVMGVVLVGALVYSNSLVKYEELTWEEMGALLSNEEFARFAMELPNVGPALKSIFYELSV